MTQPNKLRVGLIFGGRSGEHEVSLKSAASIMQAIDPTKYDLVPIGIAKSGGWLTGPETHQQLLAQSNQPSQAEASQADMKSLALSMPETGPLDVVFPVLHGTYGEDGSVQGLFELMNLPYVGAGVAASATCMDKALCKDIFRAHGLPIVKHQVILRQAWQADSEAVLTACEAALSYPMFTKPANLGSSVGVGKAKNRAELRQGITEAARFDRKIIVEQGLDVREIEVSVLGNDDPIASVVGEVIPSREFYSYAAKYVDGDSQLLIPAPLDETYVELIQKLAIMAFKALDCAGLARCDFFLEKQTGELFINELNTMPGFTNISMYPKLWEASGLAYPDLIDRLLQLALERHAEKQASLTDFDVLTAE